MSAAQSAFHPTRPEDAGWMRRALHLARAAGDREEVPVGAVVVLDGAVLGEAGNRTRSDADPTAHAEILALRAAGARRGDWRLDGAVLYATLEPCAMCAGAAVLARVERLVYGAPDPKAGMAGSLGCIPADPRLNHRVHITPGVLEVEAGELLRAFFRARR
jgi:tRNA(adenine34) deaminase